MTQSKTNENERSSPTRYENVSFIPGTYRLQLEVTYTALVRCGLLNPILLIIYRLQKIYSPFVTNDYLNNLKTLPFNNSELKYK